MKESERAFLRAYARLGNVAEAAIEASYSEPGARHVAARLGIEVGPLGRPQAGSLSDRMALATLVIEGYGPRWMARRLSRRISENGIFRILKSVREKEPRFSAVAAVISHPEDEEKVLICREKEARAVYGKRIGDVTIPMSFKGRQESDEAGLSRLVLREVFADPRLMEEEAWRDWYNRAIEKVTTKPLAEVLVVDTLVLVHHLRLAADPEQLGGFKSAVTYDHQWVDVDEARGRAKRKDKGFHLRWGVVEALEEYQTYLRISAKLLQERGVPLRVSPINARLLEVMEA